MKIMMFLLAFNFALGGLSHAFEGSSTQFTFASVMTGQEILTADDNYFNRMSPAEIAIRTLSTTADKTVNDLKVQ